MRRESGRNQAQIKRLGQSIREALNKDRQPWAEAAGEDVENLLTRYPPLSQESCKMMRG